MVPLDDCLNHKYWQKSPCTLLLQHIKIHKQRIVYGSEVFGHLKSYIHTKSYAEYISVYEWNYVNLFTLECCWEKKRFSLNIIKRTLVFTSFRWKLWFIFWKLDFFKALICARASKSSTAKVFCCRLWMRAAPFCRRISVVDLLSAESLWPTITDHS